MTKKLPNTLVWAMKSAGHFFQTVILRFVREYMLEREVKATNLLMLNRVQINIHLYFTMCGVPGNVFFHTSPDLHRVKKNIMEDICDGLNNYYDFSFQAPAARLDESALDSSSGNEDES